MFSDIEFFLCVKNKLKCAAKPLADNIDPFYIRKLSAQRFEAQKHKQYSVLILYPIRVDREKNFLDELC